MNSQTEVWKSVKHVCIFSAVMKVTKVGFELKYKLL